METILPIIVAIAFFVFQAYANYQKEQEKARKRNPGQPRTPAESAEQYVEEYPLTEEPTVPDYWEESAYPDSRQVSTPARRSQKPTPPQPVFDEYSGVVDEAEMWRIQRVKARQKQLIPQRLAVEGEEAGTGLVNDEAEFDLRDAVIKSAILERPYQ